MGTDKCLLKSVLWISLLNGALSTESANSSPSESIASRIPSSLVSISQTSPMSLSVMCACMYAGKLY